MEDDDAWISCHKDDLWIFDKCILSTKLGYNCGPADVEVSEPGIYIVRPCVNLAGMSRGAEFRHIEKETTELPAGHFWCEIFDGRHLSVDFDLNKESRTYEQGLTTEGTREFHDPLWKYNRWVKVDDVVEFPLILTELKGDYDCINCEFIGDRLIEVHLRANEDMGEYTEVIPIWSDSEKDDTKFFSNGFNYVEDKDYKRIGFYKR